MFVNEYSARDRFTYAIYHLFNKLSFFFSCKLFITNAVKMCFNFYAKFWRDKIEIPVPSPSIPFAPRVPAEPTCVNVRLDRRRVVPAVVGSRTRDDPFRKRAVSERKYATRTAITSAV